MGAAIGLLTIVCASYQVLLYGSFTGGLTFQPPGTVRTMDVISLAVIHVHGFAEHVAFWAAAIVVGMLGFCIAPLAGLIGIVQTPVRTWRPDWLLRLGALAAGFVPFLLFAQFGGSQNFFTYYGLVAGSLLAAEGLVILWRRWMGSRNVTLKAAAGAVSGLASATGCMYAISDIMKGRSQFDHYLVAFGLLSVVLAASLLWAVRSDASRRGPRLFALVAAVVMFGTIAVPVETVPTILRDLRVGAPLYDWLSGELPGGLYRGLVWVRDHTKPADVLAVNNQDVGTIPAYMYYSAFTEREIFLEGWALTARANEIGAEAVTYHGRVPFPERLALNRAVFERADYRALRTMFERYGVRYLLVDRLHGTATGRLGAISRLIYSSPALAVYRIGALRPGAPAG